MASSASYVEDNIIILPILTADNNISKIGDLWDCQTSKIVGENIFDKNLDKSFVDISPIQLLDYELKHFKNFGDRIKTYKINGEMGLELLTGLIKVDGLSNFNYDDKQMENVEYLSCNYNRETFSIYVKSSADKLISKTVREKILKKEIRATHFVRGIILGARLNAEINIISDEGSGKSDFRGEVSGEVSAEGLGKVLEKVVCGKVNPSVKASLGYLDSKEGTRFSKRINIQTIPSMKIETNSIADMFLKIDDFEEKVEKANYYPEFADNLIGLPIRFILVPIKHFIEIKIKKFYLKMSENLISNFSEMIVNVQEMKKSGYIVKRILKHNFSLIKVISDIHSSLNQEIREYEKNLQDIGHKYNEEAFEVLKKYKNGEASDFELLNIINKFNHNCNPNKIFEKIAEFVDKGKSELKSIKEVDINHLKIEIEVLTSIENLNEFTSGDQVPKIWLHSSDEVPECVFLKFYEVTEPLAKLGFRTGVAIKSISSIFELCIKVRGKTVSYKIEQEILYILSIISASVGVGSKNEIRFHSMNAEIFNTQLPFKSEEEMLDVHYLIENLKVTREITIATTASETLHLITIRNDRWKCYVPLDAVKTAFLAIRNLRILMNLHKFKNVDWIAGNLGECRIEASGLLFFIRNGKVEAVCLDDFDVSILIENFDVNNSNITPILSPENMKYTFYPERTINVLKTIEAVEFGERLNLRADELYLKDFYCVANSDLVNALELACSLKLDDDFKPLEKLAKFASLENSKVMDILTKYGFECNEKLFKERIANNVWKNLLTHCIEDIINLETNFSTKIEDTFRVLNEVILNGERNNVNLLEKVDFVLDELVNDPKCFHEIIEYNTTYKNDEIISRCRKMKEILSKKVTSDDYINNSKIFHTKNLHSTLTHGLEIIPLEIMKKYIDKINFSEQEYDGVTLEFAKEIENKHYNHLISKLLECSNGIRFFVIYKELKKLFDKTDLLKSVSSLLNQLSDKDLFEDIHYEVIWKNNRFKHIMLSVKDEPLIMKKLSRFPCGSNTMTNMPAVISKIMVKQRRRKIDTSLPEIINNFEQFTEILIKIQRDDEIPESFLPILAKSLIQNKILFDSLQQLDILKLFGYDSIDRFFPNPLDVSSINEAINIIEIKRESEDQNCIIENFKVEQFFNVSDDRLVSQMNPDVIDFIQEIPENISLKICPKFSTVFGESIKIMNKKQFIRISPIIAKQYVSEQETEGYFKKVLVYLTQKVKMWGCYALTADSISELLIESKISNNSSNTPLKPTIFPIFRMKSTFKLPDEKKKRASKPFSKLDAIVGIINSVDCIVGHDILKIIGKFPLSIPLIIPNLDRENSYRCLLPLLKHIMIKWSPTPGKIIENILFNDKYKLIVTLRIGEAVEGKCGKSTILNQVLCAKNIFSCCGEPGGDRGKPVTLDGSVEFIWLTQETSSRKLWESVLQAHYKDSSNEVILLANLHGNSIEFEEILNFLKLISTSYIVFLMPDDYENLDEKFQHLLKILDIEHSTDTISYLVVDPPSDCEHLPEENIINTSQLNSDYSIAKLRSLIGNCLKIDGKFLDKEKFLSKSNLLIEGYIETKESKDLMNYIEYKTCASAKKCLQLQKVEKFHDEYLSIWRENSDLRKIIELVMNVLSLNLNSRIKAMLDIEKNLSRLSDKESSSARQEFITLYDLYQKTISSNADEKGMIAHLKNQLNLARKNIDNINIGPEHIFREIGKLFEIYLVNSPRQNPYENTAQQYAELLIAGHAIELLNGDSNSIPGPWLSAIFSHVYKQIPSLRIFVISILGLQSSGKSTLLNALFACNFAVSVGRCTRGLFIRLLFLEELMKEKLKVDAILLIDTEGLGAPERQNEVDADKKDRSMATFAMSISHLTLVNIRGESMSDLTQILQIAIVAMTRLEIANITPDILIIQHLSERNDERITTANTIIGEALEEAINVAIKDNINLGVKDSKCLKSLRQTLSCGQLFFKFRQFKNGASAHSPPSDEYHQDVVDLYNSILNIVEKNESRADLMQWNILVQSYWDAVKKENFMRFKDVKDLQEFLLRNDMISKVKELIVSAFRYHHDILLISSAEFAQKINENLAFKDSILNQIRDELDSIPDCPRKIKCDKCKHCVKNINDLYDFVKNKSYMNETHTTILNYTAKTKKWFYKLLSQILNARSVQKVTTSNLLRKIEMKLRDLSEEDKINDEYGIDNQIKKIWHEIEIETTGQVHQVQLKKQIINEIKETYENSEFIIEVFETISSLPDQKAISKKSDKKYFFMKPFGRSSDSLDSGLVHKLEGELESIDSHLLEESKTEIFQTGMIRSLKDEVEKIIKNFEESNELKFIPKFKWIIHMYALHKFHIKMFWAQQKWDKHNNPVEILRIDKPLFLNVIRERLKYGFSYRSDGSIAANCLLNAIKQRAKEAIDKERLEEVLKIDWLFSSVSVRSEFFSEMAQQVERGHIFDALNYFRSPKFHIENWFKGRVDCFSIKNQRKHFINSFNKELMAVLKEIQRQTTISSIRIYIENYIYPYDGINLPHFLDPRKAIKADFDIFVNKIIEVLNDEENHKKMLKEIKFSKPSEDERVMNRLGCTEACPLCAALCWSQRGHDNDTGETRKHHTCHQPMGLAGHHYYNTNELVSIPCHKQRSNSTYFENGKSFSWSKIKQEKRYVDWKFEEHVNFRLNEMMIWFFFKLNDGIASRLGLKPAPSKQQQKSSFGSFIAAIKSMFQNHKVKID